MNPEDSDEQHQCSHSSWKKKDFFIDQDMDAQIIQSYRMCIKACVDSVLIGNARDKTNGKEA